MDIVKTRFDVEAFLRDHWQRKPLLIRNPWAQWTNPLEPDELAGLACEDGVESRLVIQSGHGDWLVEQGPMAETRFSTLGGSPWTLLVQAVDHHVPDVAALLDPFRFVPNWRIDDVMVSYAADGGGVGPHFDQYDVFLIQGLGKRRWRIGGHRNEGSERFPHDDLRLLARFDATDEWVLEPGDILYVPPGIAHDGVAVGDDCMTYSIGFRAPSRSELIAHWSDHLLDGLQEDDRYEDPGLSVQGNPGEISDDAIARLHAMISAAMLDRDAFARWFGQYNSTPKYADADCRSEEPISSDEIGAALIEGTALLRNPASRFSFIRKTDDLTLLFADGECFECTGPGIAFAETLCAQDSFVADPDLAQSEAGIALIEALFNQGSVMFDAED